MSTLEKAIGLLQGMPEKKLEAIYLYIQFVNSQTDGDEIAPAHQNLVNPFLGKIDKCYKSSPESSIEKRQKGFQGLMSFAGTLPEDFDYKRELEESREAKYARFI